MITTTSKAAINWESEALLSQIADKIHKPLTEIIRLTRYMQTKQDDTETSRLSAIMLESSEQLELLIEDILQMEKQKQIQILIHDKLKYPQLYKFDVSAIRPSKDLLGQLDGSSKNRISKADLKWLMELESKVLENIDSSLLSVPWLAVKLATSERQLFRKISKYTGQTPNKYIRYLKLYRAKELLESYACTTVNEVAIAVGMKDPHYFSKLFTQEFGVKPRLFF